MAAASKKKSISKKNAAAKKSAPVKKTAAPKSRPKPVASVVKFPRPSLIVSPTPGTERVHPRMQVLLDKNEITELLTAFARGVDRIDENLLRSVFHSDATLDLGPGIFQGGGNDYIHWLMGVLQGLRSSHHLIGNVRIELDGDMATVESYFHLHIRVEKPIGREDVFMGGRHLDRFERRPGATGVWKIMHRKQIIDWVRTEAVSDIFYHQNPDALWSYRTKTDTSYQMTQFPGHQSGGKMPSFIGRHYESKSIKF